MFRSPAGMSTAKLGTSDLQCYATVLYENYTKEKMVKERSHEAEAGSLFLMCHVLPWQSLPVTAKERLPVGV